MLRLAEAGRGPCRGSKLFHWLVRIRRRMSAARGGFATSRFTNESQGLPLVNGETDAIDRLDFSDYAAAKAPGGPGK